MPYHLNRTPEAVARMTASVRARALVRASCPRCHREFSSMGIVKHEMACKKPLATNCIPQGHHRCAAHPERIIPTSARHCFLCEERDPEFARLEALIAAGFGHVQQDKITPEMARRARV